MQNVQMSGAFREQVDAAQRDLLGQRTARSVVVPLQALVDVAGDPYVVPLRVNVTRKDIDESISNPAHARRDASLEPRQIYFAIRLAT